MVSRPHASLTYRAFPWIPVDSSCGAPAGSCGAPADAGNVPRLSRPAADYAGFPEDRSGCPPEYRAQVNLNKVAAKARAEEGAQAAQAIRQEIKAFGTAMLPVDVWIGPHHLVRQVSFQAPVPAPGTSGARGAGTVTATMTFTSFGAPVQVSPPPAGITSELLQPARTQPGQPVTAS